MPYRPVRRQPVEAVIQYEAPVSDTRRDLLRAAKILFAERGFYGASLAQIAKELGLTKQALLHHFGSKEHLYREVLSSIAEGLSHIIAVVRDEDPDPAGQLEGLLLRLYETMLKHPENTQLLMRELLDNRTRAQEAQSWPLKEFLDALVEMIRKAPRGHTLTRGRALARIYLVLGAISYLVASQPTLGRMYPDMKRLKEPFRSEIKRLARALLDQSD